MTYKLFSLYKEVFHKMADYRALIANCVIGGEHFTQVNDYDVRNLVRLQLDQFKVEIIQRPKFIEALDPIAFTFEDSLGKTVHTTDLVIRDLAFEDFDRAQLLARDIAELLSFATSSEVAVIGYDFPDVSPAAIRKRIMGQLQYFRPLFRIPRGERVRSFLEQTWSTYRKLRDVRQLNVAFDYYVLAQKDSQPLELRLVVTFVLFENLKHTFALEKRYPFIKGHFRSLGATSSSPGPRKTFRGLLNEMFTTVEMSPSLSAIIKLRNDLIHSGVSCLDFEDKWSMYETCHNILREYFLRLMNYKGTYCAYAGFGIIR